MRKLCIVIALTAAATLGMSGTAFADGHEDAICGNLPTGEDANSNAPGGDAGPFDNIIQGINDTCTKSNSGDGLNLGVVCGLLSGVGEITDNVSGEIASGINQALDALPTGNPCVTSPEQEENDPAGTDPDPDPTSPSVKGATDEADPVKAQNAAADGGLPRTGGSLFAGAGLGLLSLGAVARRFLS